MISLWKKCILIIVLFGLIVFLHFFAADFISLNTIKEHKDSLLVFVDGNYGYTLVLFSLIYITSTALGLPIAALLTLAAGYFFGVVVGTIVVIFSAIIGSLCTFLAVRYLFGNYIQNRYQEQLGPLNNELQRYGLYYFLALRLMAIVPFFVVNILAGLTSISLRTFLWTTALGIIPGTFVFVVTGQQLGTIQSMHDIFSIRVLFLFVALGILALLPMFVKKMQHNVS